jgi:hypothetical protein
MPIAFINAEDGSFKPQYCENPKCGKHLGITIRIHWHADDPYLGNVMEEHRSPFRRYSCGKQECGAVVDAMPMRELPECRKPPEGATLIEDERRTDAV